MIPVMAFTGTSGSGKTTLIEKVVKSLVARGYRVGTIKHHLKDIEVDREGKDSWRHRAAGATATVISTPGGIASIRGEKSEMEPRDIIERYLYDSDIVIAEGYKHAGLPGIVVHREDSGAEFTLAESKKTVAVASDTEVDTGEIPRFDLDDSESITDFIVEKFIESRKSRRVHLFVNDKALPMKTFVRDMLEKTIRGMVSAFKGTENARKITIIIEDIKREE